MKLPQKLLQIGVRLRELPKKYYVFSALGFGILLYGIVFFIPKPVEFSYAGDTCASQLTLLPGLHRETDDTSFTVTYKDKTKIGDLELTSGRVCFTPATSPEAEDTLVATAPWGGVIARKHFVIKSSPHPVANLAPLEKPIPATRPLILPLDKTDQTFDYSLKINDEETDCFSKEKQLSCDITKLALKQGASYDFSLSRHFNEKGETELHAGDLKTLNPLKITKASVKNKQTVYMRPKSFSFIADKTLGDVSVKLTRQVKKKSEEIPVKTVLEEKKLIVRLNKELARDATYKLTIERLDAKDGSTLVEPRKTTFKLSDGPRLTGANVGSYKSPLSGDIILAFDQVISPANIAKFVQVSGVAASVIPGKDHIIVRYANAPKCKNITISLKAGIKSKYGVVQKDAMQFSTRTTCHTVQTIGYSREGRPINAYFFGNGGSSILFTGAIHGNEQSSYYTMQSWINELESKGQTIPAKKQVVVVPLVSPDGFYVYGRKNAKGVNLNRNFPTSNWKKDVKISSSQIDKGGGGASGGSEPETRALMSLTNQLNPYLTVTYHSSGSIVNSNTVSPAASRASSYARMAGYGFVSDADTAEAFGFTMTGTYEDWMAETGRAAFLVELPADYGDYLYQNQSAMWAMLR